MKTNNEMDKLLTLFNQQNIITNDVYHYRGNYDTIINILQSQCLRMFHYSKFSDEINNTLSYLKKDIQDIELPGLPYGLKTFWEAFEYYMTQLDFFIASLSLSRDDPNLWKAFGSNGNGYCIRISKDHFRTITATEPVSNGEWFSGVYRVHYGEKSLYEFAEIIRDILPKISPDRNFLVEVFSMMLTLLPSFKDAQFESQKEYRIFTLDLGIKSKDKIPSKYKNLDSEKNKTNMESNKISISHIKEVIIRSNNDFNEEERRIRERLNKIYPNGEFNNLKITKSTT